MRLNDPNTVDYLGVEKDTETVIVTLVDDCDWTDEKRHLSLLQEKINRYIDFVESGEVYEQLAQTTGRILPRTTPVKISILAKYPPEGDGLRFLEQVAQAAENVGIGLSFKVLPAP